MDSVPISTPDGAVSCDPSLVASSDHSVQCCTEVLLVHLNPLFKPFNEQEFLNPEMKCTLTCAFDFKTNYVWKCSVSQMRVTNIM